MTSPKQNIESSQLLPIGFHEELVRRFADGWKEGAPSSLDKILAQVPPDEQAKLFSVLLRIELQWRRLRGETLSQMEYAARYPEFSDYVSDVFQTLPTEVSVSLDVVAGPHANEVYEFTGHQTLLIGRAEQTQLSLNDDEHLSRYHCRLEVNPPQIRLIDLDSRNGTYVNGEKVRERDLRHADRLRFGRSECVVRIIEPQQTRPELMRTVISPSLAEEPSPISQFAGGLIAPSIPGYELLEELGRGGLGVVYRARQLATGNIFAVKFILPAHATDKEATRLFLREASVLSQLQHPRIVRFHELGISDSLLYLVMEYVPSIPFAQLVERLPIAKRVQLACGVVCRVLDALEFAHGRGFVHRDVKPSNILLTNESRKLRVKLADFGLAKNYLTAGMSGFTQEGTARGALAYMPPEQVVDCRSAKPPADLYAVGVTLFNYLTGELPFVFTGPSNAMRMILEAAPRRADELVPEIPTALANIIGRTLEKAPANRHSGTAELRAALMQFMKPGDDSE